MKIIFICGSLQSGKDGVGDYTRLLSSELIKIGHLVSIVSINDKFTDECIEENQLAGNVSIAVLRIPSHMKTKASMKIARLYIDKFDPDILSLQFVLFSFHNKGLPFFLSSQLKSLGTNRKWQIMFHELWVGIEEGASLKFKLWGFFQRHLIKSLVINLTPVSVHTHARVYQYLLNSIGVRVNSLALFSNVCYNFSSHIIKDGGVGQNKKIVEFAIFGSIHVSNKLHKFLEEAGDYGKNHQLTFRFFIIGRNNSQAENTIELIESFGMMAKLLGEQPEDVISSLLQSVDYGLSTTPYTLADKSGTVAAMLYHGKTVICVSNPWNLKKSSVLPGVTGVTEYREGILSEFLNTKHAVPSIGSASEVAKIFIYSLL